MTLLLNETHVLSSRSKGKKKMLQYNHEEIRIFETRRLITGDRNKINKTEQENDPLNS